MEKSILHWGIIGPGRIAEKFSEAVTASELATLQAVASRDLKRAQNFADRYQAPTAYGCYEELLADTEVDAVYIATPHPYHTEWAIKCAEAGKHILCEKPAAMNLAETQTIIKAAQTHDVFFMEAFMYRCHPQTYQIVEWIQSGAIGEVRMIIAQFGFDGGNDTSSRLLSKELGGGGILDVGCYPMSFARLVAGAHSGLPFQNPEVVKAVGTLHPDTEVDIWTTASLQFPNSITAQLSCATQANLGTQSRIIGSQGTITVESPWFCSGSVYLEDLNGKITEKKYDHQSHLYLHEVDAVARHVHDRQAPSPMMSWEDTLGNMQALDQWRKKIGLRYASDK